MFEHKHFSLFRFSDPVSDELMVPEFGEAEVISCFANELVFKFSDGFLSR